MGEALELSRPAGFLSSQRRTHGSRVFTLVVGGVLLAAAAIKAVSPIELTALHFVYGVPAWILVIIVQIEILIATIFIVDIRFRAAWTCSIMLFSAFAVFSLYRAIAGFESCGCFGSLKIHPWHTFAFDVSVVVSLLVFRGDWKNPLWHLDWRQGRIWAAAYFATGGLALSFMLSKPKHVADADGLEGQQSVVIVEPAQWIGQDFPLTAHLRPTVDIAHGAWIVLMYHHDCPKCQAALPQYEQLAQRLATRPDAARILLVELPEYGNERPVASNDTFYARLSKEHDWFVQAPIEIVILDGKVTSASPGLPSVFAVAEGSEFREVGYVQHRP
jgi:thiol-disulfide isomerase/thioredoxin